jgi:hypothetical protein
MYSALQVDHQGMGKEEMMEEVAEATMMVRIAFWDPHHLIFGILEVGSPREPAISVSFWFL